MKIDNSSFANSQIRGIKDQASKVNKAQLGDFKTQVENNLSKSQGASHIEAKRVDKIEISDKALQKHDSFDVAKLSAKIIADVNQPTNASRISEIQSRVEAGKYNVDPNAIAKIILNI